MNIARDKIVNEKLKNDGWIVLRFWEMEIKEKLDFCVEQIVNCLDHLYHYKKK